MMKQRDNIIYWVFTGLLCILMIISASRYFLDLDTFRSNFEALGYNGRIVIPLAIAKILGVATLMVSRAKRLKEWVYAGFLFNFLLALEAHIAIQDEFIIGPFIALTLLVGSYVFYRKKEMVKSK